MCCNCTFSSFGQQKTEEITIDFSFLEDFLNLEEEQAEAPLDDLLNTLQTLLINPLDLNACSASDLAELFILDAIQIEEIIAHRINYGDYLVLEELMTLPGMDLDIIKKIRPFIKVYDQKKTEKITSKWITQGEQQLILRIGQTLEKSLGFKLEQGKTAFLGNPQKYYAQYRHQHLDHFRFGFTLEKDAGEPWHNDGRITSFYSGYLSLRDYGRWKDLVLGDYSLQLGQGLIMNTRFASGKSALVMNIKRGGRAVNPYSGVNELIYFRGLAGTYRWGTAWSSTLFASYKPIHAGLQADLNHEDIVTSFYENGTFKSIADFTKFNTLQGALFGYQVAHTSSTLKINNQSVYYVFDKRLDGNSNLYQLNNFRGRQLFLTSIDYQYTFKKALLFGESGWSQSKSSAHIVGLVSSLSRRVDISLVFRHIPSAFHVIHHQPFGEIGHNEQGLYWGTTMRIIPQWRIDTYMDVFRFPWLRFRISQPSEGREHLVRITHFKKKRYEWYLQYKWEQKDQDLSSEFAQFVTRPVTRYNWRLHGQYGLNKIIELRSRFEFTGYQFTKKENGIMAFQDIIYSPIGSAITGSARIAYFATSGFNTRIYTYERDLIYNYALPFYYGKGWRSYINLRWRLGQLNLEGRLSRTLFTDRQTIGIGQDLIPFNHRTDLKIQIKWNW